MKNQFIPLSEKYGKELVSDYLINEMSLKDMSKKYGVRDYIVGRALKHLGVTLRNNKEVGKISGERGLLSNRIYDINEDYFKVINKESAYILGFIAADGNVYVRDGGTYVLTIGLSSIDSDFLNMIKSKLGYSGEVLHKKVYCAGKQYDSSELKINSKTMIEDLIELNITPRKSLTLQYPNIDDEYFIDFFRGFFDGDGSVGVQKTSSITPQIRFRVFSGSKSFIETIQEKLTHHGLKPKKVIKSKGKQIYEIAYSTLECELLFELLYHDENCLRLPRKYEKFKEAIESRNTYILNNNKELERIV